MKPKKIFTTISPESLAKIIQDDPPAKTHDFPDKGSYGPADGQQKASRQGTSHQKEHIQQAEIEQLPGT